MALIITSKNNYKS